MRCLCGRKFCYTCGATYESRRTCKCQMNFEPHHRDEEDEGVGRGRDNATRWDSFERTSTTRALRLEPRRGERVERIREQAPRPKPFAPRPTTTAVEATPQARAEAQPSPTTLYWNRLPGDISFAPIEDPDSDIEIEPIPISTESNTASLTYPPAPEERRSSPGPEFPHTQQAFDCPHTVLTGVVAPRCHGCLRPQQKMRRCLFCRAVMCLGCLEVAQTGFWEGSGSDEEDEGI